MVSRTVLILSVCKAYVYHLDPSALCVLVIDELLSFLHTAK
jgi:hypothetical protein